MDNVTDSSTSSLSGTLHSVSTDWQKFALALLVSSVCVAALYADTIFSMAHVWVTSRTFAHGLLVFPATAYLVWCHWPKVRNIVPMPSWWGLVSLVFADLVWSIGHLLSVGWLQQAAVISMLPGLIWTIMGTAVVRSLTWPLGFLLFMLPIGSSIEPWLQDVTVWLVLSGLWLVGIPHLYDSHVITVPTGIWEVDLDCGGLRYLLPGLALTYAFASVVFKHASQRWLFLALSAVVLMLANGLRAFGVIVGDHLGVAEGADHRVFSYTIYGITMPALLWFGLKWQVTRVDRPPDQVHLREPNVSHTSAGIVLMAMLAVVVLAIAPLGFRFWGTAL